MVTVLIGATMDEIRDLLQKGSPSGFSFIDMISNMGGIGSAVAMIYLLSRSPRFPRFPKRTISRHP